MESATGRSGTEAGLRALLADLADEIHDAVWSLLPDGNTILMGNASFERAFGCPRDVLIDQPGRWWECLHPDDVPRMRNYLERLQQEPRVEHHFRTLRHDEDERQLRGHLRAVRNESGELVRIDGVARDVTHEEYTEEMLRELRGIYHSLAESLPLNILRKDLDGKFVFANERFCQSHGVSLGEMYGKTDFDLFPRELAEKYTQDDHKVLQRGDVLHDVEEHDAGGGNSTFVEVLKGPVRDDEGRMVGIQVIFWDVTERKQVEAALQHERYLLHTLMDHLPDSIYFKDTESRFVRVSRALAEKFGLSGAAQAVGKSDADFFTAEHAEQARLDEQRIMQSGAPVVDLEEKETWPDGSTTWASTTKLPLIDREGSVIGTFGVSRDITKRKLAEDRLEHANRELQREIADRKQAEERLARERDLLRTLMDHLPDMIFVKDADGRYVTCNSALMRMLGVDRLEEMVGKTDEAFAPRELAEQYLADDRRVIASGEPLINREETSLDADGNLLWILTTKVPVRDASGRVTGLVGIGRDITKRKRAEQALRAAKEAADAASRAKSDFLANMSHEIRTPMNAIIGMTELLLESQLSPTQREYLEMVQASGDSLLTLINDILDFSKIEAGKLELDPSEFDVRESLGDTMKSLALRAHLKGLELAFRIDRSVPERLIADAGRLRQIVVNLVGNAIKFTEEGEVVLEVYGTRTDDSLELELTVRDTGIGIPEEKREAIFQEFEQADTSTTRRYGGTGLGLSISARLCQMMGGKISVESEEGHGSEFHVEIPCGVADAASASTGIPTGTVEGTRVLVVDDNATNRRIVHDVLRNWGIEAELATSAAEAMTRLKDESVDLVLCDVNMPEVDGYTLVEWIRGRPELRQTPIIMLTSSVRSGDQQRRRQLAVADQLLKPVKQSELFDAIVRTLGVTEAEDAHDGTDVPNKPALRPLQVLLAEDNQVNQKLALGVLRGQGHQVTVAANGEEAIARWRENHFDVILMDLQMPKMDGLDATRRIRSLEEESGSRIPIIAMTAHAMKGDRDRCLDAGMDDYLPKPIRIQELRAKFAALFGNESATAGDRPVEGAGDDAPLVDWNAALETVNGNTSLLKDVVDAFLEDTPRMVREMQQSLVDRDPSSLKRAAHSLKGSLMFLNSRHLIEQAREIESLGEREDLEEAAPRVEQLVQNLEPLTTTLQQYVQQH